MAVKTLATKTFQNRNERRRGITYVNQHKMSVVRLNVISQEII
jgi:hypothetical protein